MLPSQRYRVYTSPQFGRKGTGQTQSCETQQPPLAQYGRGAGGEGLQEVERFHKGV
jgi:hypothetical protein